MEHVEGAEATITVDGAYVTKHRHAKTYRHPELDERLREERTDHEHRLLEKAAANGVPVPGVEKVDAYTLRMDHIEGSLLKEVVADELSWCDTLGAHVARLHNAGMIHGDLTTSNVIVADDTVYLIDFGLGKHTQRNEDFATDLHLLKEVFASTHTVVADDAMTRVLDAYKRAFTGDVDSVLQRYDTIAERGRYH